MESNEVGVNGVSEIRQMSWQEGKEEKNKVKDENKKELNRQCNDRMRVRRLIG